MLIGRCLWCLYVAHCDWLVLTWIQNRIFAAAKGNVKQMGKAPSVFAWLMGIAKKQVEEHKKKR